MSLVAAQDNIVVRFGVVYSKMAEAMANVHRKLSNKYHCSSYTNKDTVMARATIGMLKQVKKDSMVELGIFMQRASGSLKERNSGAQRA